MKFPEISAINTCQSRCTIPAYIYHAPVFKDCLSENPVSRTVPNLPEAFLIKISHNMLCILIKATWNNFPIPGYNRVEPQPCTSVRQPAFYNKPALFLHISSVFPVRRKPETGILLIYYLHRLQGQRCTKFFRH